MRKCESKGQSLHSANEVLGKRQLEHSSISDEIINHKAELGKKIFLLVNKDSIDSLLSSSFSAPKSRKIASASPSPVLRASSRQWDQVDSANCHFKLSQSALLEHVDNLVSKFINCIIINLEPTSLKTFSQAADFLMNHINKKLRSSAEGLITKGINATDLAISILRVASKKVGISKSLFLEKCREVTGLAENQILRKTPSYLFLGEVIEDTQHKGKGQRCQ